MNNNLSGQIDTVIKVKEIIWDLLEQWKAILITGLLFMILVAGVKYSKDVKNYNMATAEKNVTEQKNASVEERIAAVIETLPEEEKATVVTIIKQNDWIKTEKEYINNSILMNTDPTNQKTLVADYYISTPQDSDSVGTALVYGYRAYLKDEYAIDTIGKAIAPDTERNYISELISVEKTDNTLASPSANPIMEIRIVLPTSADAKVVEAALTDVLQGYSPELSDKISPHSISVLNTSEAYLYNSDAVNNRNSILYSISTLQNNTKSMQTSLSDAQKAAIEAITAIKETEKTATGKEIDKDNAKESTDSKPGISSKYLVAGFVIGVILYAAIYLLVIIIKGCINCASVVEYYTKSRLFGEVYHQEKHRGLDILLNSALVDKYRYHGKLDEDNQVQKTAAKLDAHCQHEGANNLTALFVSEISDVNIKVVDAIKARGLIVTAIEPSMQLDDNYLLALKDVVFIVDDSVKVRSLTSLTAQLKDFDVNLHGSIYYSCI